MRQADPHAWMLTDAIELFQGTGRLHRQFFQLTRAGDTPRWGPSVDMFGNERELCLLIALPGVMPERLDVSLVQHVVVVQGERSLGASSGVDTIFQLEIPYGRFERRVQLPYADFRMVDMLLQNGCLRLTLERMA